jgi:hypothetical protein
MSTQSNTQAGVILVAGNESLVGKEGHLVELESTGLGLPDAVSDLAIYVVDDGAASGENSAVIPLAPERNIRLRAKSTGSKGDVLALADPGTAADKGKVRALPSVAGIYFSPGIAEEDFADGQLVKVRPLPRLVRVKTAVTLASTNGTAAAAAADLAALAAEAEKIGDDVRALHASLAAQGLV